MERLSQLNFRELLREAELGNEAAISRLVERYGPAIRRVVRKHLSAHMRRQFDSDDFMQTVWKSFFTRERDHQVFETPQQLSAFLVRMTRNKVVDRHRRLEQTLRRDIRREVTATDFNATASYDGVSASPTPSRIIAAKEEVERLLANEPAYCSQAARMKSEGRSYEEIAQVLNMHKDSVRRLLKRLRERANSGDD